MTARVGNGATDRASRHLAEQERTLRGMLRAGAVVLGVLMLATATRLGVVHAVLVYGVGVALHLAHLAALRSGRTRLVAQSHCVTYLVWITAVMALDGGGLRAPAALVYPPIVLLSGLVWSGRAAFGMAVAASACGGALVLLEREGLLPLTGSTLTPFALWMVLTACVVITAAILRFSLDIIHRSNEDALRLEERLRQGQRLEALGRLACGVAHDLNNLLTIVLGNLDLVRIESGRPADADEALSEIRGAVDRAAVLTRRLLAFGRRQAFNPALVDVGATVAAFEPLLRRLLPENVRLVLERDPAPTPIVSDPAQLEQIVLNLVANARDALGGGGGGTVTVATSAILPRRFAREPDLPPGAIWLVVTDDGAGMSKEVRAHLFEPFFTTKEPTKGTGLGLATVHGIVSQSQGRIVVDSEPGKGTSFAIAFPRAGDDARPASSPRVPGPAPTSSATILLVEDDPAVRGVAAAILSSAAFRVLQAGSGAEADRVSEAFAGKIDLLLTDVVMPGRSGPRVARALRARRGDIKILYVSGHAEELIAKQGVLQPGVHFLAKPFTRDALIGKVRDVLESPEPGEIGVDGA
jgi:signal transduction histidine kinase/CheY-like chemotaxis protein